MERGESDRIVLVASGFGLWLAGRHVASARWGDVERVRAIRPQDEHAPLVVEVALAGGSVVELREDVPGWLAFLHAARVQLAGMPPAERWRAELPAGGGELLLFDRRARRR
jgi:hypothetical protein